MKEIEQFNLRLSPEQKTRLEQLARGAGLSLNEYLATLIDEQYAAESDTLEQIEQLRVGLTKPKQKRKKHWRRGNAPMPRGQLDSVPAPKTAQP